MPRPLGTRIGARICRWPQLCQRDLLWSFAPPARICFDRFGGEQGRFDVRQACSRNGMLHQRDGGALD